MRNVPNAAGMGTCLSMAGYGRRPAHGAAVAVGSGLRRADSCEKERAAPREGAALQDHDEGNETTGGEVSMRRDPRFTTVPIFRPLPSGGTPSLWRATP